MILRMKLDDYLKDTMGGDKDKYWNNLILNEAFKDNDMLAKYAPKAIELYDSRKDRVYMKMAEALSELSYAKRSKVGCVIVSMDGQIVSQGYNGTPTGFDNVCEITDEHTHDLVTKPEVLHAESNAISKCAKWGGSTNYATLYVTMSPCYECAKLIIQAGIKRVVYKEQYRDDTGIRLLERAGITVSKIKE